MPYSKHYLVGVACIYKACWSEYILVAVKLEILTGASLIPVTLPYNI
jgi:hypothetical protein